MFNPLNLISKFIKSSNQKELARIGKIVQKINSLENELKKLNERRHTDLLESFGDRPRE